MDVTIDGVWDGSEYPTREDAAVELLEDHLQMHVGFVSLEPLGGRRYRVLEVDGIPREGLPILSIEPVGEGFAPTGLSC